MVCFPGRCNVPFHFLSLSWPVPGEAFLYTLFTKTTKGVINRYSDKPVSRPSRRQIFSCHWFRFCVPSRYIHLNPTKKKGSRLICRCPIRGNSFTKMGTLSLKSGKVFPKLGDLSSKSRNSSPRLGDLSPKLGNSSPKLGSLSPKLRNVSTKWGNLSLR